MIHIEAAIIEIIEKLRRSGPCYLDDVVACLPNFRWGDVFVTVDRMSRDGLVSLHQVGYSTYQIALHSQFAKSSSTSSRGGGRDDNESSGDLTREGGRASGSLTLCASGSDVGRAIPEMERV